MAPLEIKILMHYYGNPHNDYVPNEPVEGIRQSITNLTNYGLLMDKLNSMEIPTYMLTEKGRFYAGAICATPLPVALWKIPEE